MTDTRRCPECDEPIPPDSPSGLCPKCLYQAGFASEPPTQRQSGSAGAKRFQLPTPEQLARAFPQLERLELLGCGGMGAVYKAWQPSLDRMVAIKILPRELAADAAFVERFLREAKTLARLGNHPHIVAIHDVGQSEGLLYVVMEYVDGVNLRAALREQQLTPKESLSIVAQICDALQFAHDQGVVHRDIKPENILLDRRGRVKIADFGLAKLIAEEAEEHALTGTHQVLGTLRYMAPEQLEGSRKVDHRADIYSLGVVFYEILTGELPMGHFPPPSKKADVDARLDDVVLRALHRAPEDRYQHASEVKSDVEQIDSMVIPPKMTPIPAGSVPVTSRAGSTPWMLLAVILLMCGVGPLLLIVCGIGAYWLMPVHDVVRPGDPSEAVEFTQAKTLSHMARIGDVEQVKQLLNTGEDPDQKDEAGATPLLRAAIAGHAPVAKALVDAGASLEIRSPTGTTPLMEAAFGGHLSVAKVLLDGGAVMRATDNEGRTALDHAVASDNVPMTELLIDRGAQVTGAYQTWLAHRLLRTGKAQEAYDAIEKVLSGNTSSPAWWQYTVAGVRYRTQQPAAYLHALGIEAAQRLGREEDVKLHLGQLKTAIADKTDPLYLATTVVPQPTGGVAIDQENFIEDTFWVTSQSLDSLAADWRTPIELRFEQQKRESNGRKTSSSTSTGTARGMVKH